eukprot:gnl/Carplike_NY0171/7408_a10217_225.p1 GENE.gnl/Carplike_NY0171/7408_a10217_225~~gnl/Carplike_NY0171/7408_a10217_225.p1  ORF type:complete len:103 (+),score=16.50 gnl/Carplike_NY0171/7408_a10217_225:215-523(+)
MLLLLKPLLGLPSSTIYLPLVVVQLTVPSVSGIQHLVDALSVLTHFTGHTNRVLHARLGPDNVTVVSAGLRFWRVFSSQPEKETPSESDHVDDVIGRGLPLK